MLIAKDVPTYFNPSQLKGPFSSLFFEKKCILFIYFNKEDNIKSVFKEKKKIKRSLVGFTILDTVINETKKE